ncbi:jasmonate-induced oxygenase 1 [Euphorbia lathyris]|uniref:jasmonate-induced oxygenase 1 n=1 Tax=Euphorbia lathyris TaxID=212925 RepID=UPI00331419CB
MAFSPEPMPENPVDFRAPPPSPIASGRKSSFANDDVLTEFLEHLRVPDLVLPDNIFPRQIIFETPPVIDFQSLIHSDSDSIGRMLDSLARIGCFQLVNYGIPSDSIKLALALAAGIFSTPPDKRAAVTRSPERAYGFEEVHGEEENEEFVWCRDKNLKLDMESIWPHSGYSNFSEKMERVVAKMEKVGKKIKKVVEEKSEIFENGRKEMVGVGSVCYFQRHKESDEKRGNLLGYEVIRMLVRGNEHSHAFTFHLSSNFSQFHVYSKKGWLSFSPHKHAIIVTVGDQIQIESGGKYKQVLGRPILKKEDSISMAFLYSPSSTSHKPDTISLTQQLVFFLLVTLLYQFFCSFF